MTTVICHPHKASDGKKVSVADVVEARQQATQSDCMIQSRFNGVVQDINFGIFTRIQLGHMICAIEKILQKGE